MPAIALSYEDRRDAHRRGALRPLGTWTRLENEFDALSKSVAHRRNQCPLHLVRLAQHGDRRAFEALWERYSPTVKRILLTMVTHEEAEDLYQEVAVTAFRSMASLQQRKSFPSWLFTIARNVGRDALAARRHCTEVPLEEATAANLEATDSGDPIAAGEILAEIQSLPDCYRAPLTLRLLLELSGPEIALKTGMTEGSVRVNLCRGMKLLRQRLSRLD